MNDLDDVPQQLQVHAVTFTVDQLAQAVETLLSAISGRQLMPWPTQAIVLAGATVTMSEGHMVRSDQQYAIADGRMHYSLSVLTMADGEPQKES